MGGGRTSHFERQWNEADAIRSIYMDEYEEIPFPWKSRLVPQYPDKLPEIKIFKRKGVRTDQVQSVQEKLIDRAKTLIGSEMIFDLAEYAKDLLQNLAKKKVSFHEEMTLKRISSETAISGEKNPTSPSTSPLIIDPELRELERRIKEEIELKEQLVQSSRLKHTEEASPLPMVPRMVKFDPPLMLMLPDSERPVSISSVIVKDPTMEFDVGNAFMAVSEERIELMLTQVRFESSFYSTGHGRRKLEALCKRLQDLATLKYSPLYARILGGTLVMPMATGERLVELWIAAEPYQGVSLARLLDCCGNFSLPKAMSYFEAILTALAELHSSNHAHQDLNTWNICMSTSSAKPKLINPLVSRLLHDLHQIHPISPKFSLPPEAPWRPPELLSRSGVVGKKADIWNAGQVLLQMIFGMNILDGLEDPSDASSLLSQLPSQIKSLLEAIFQKESTARPNASELVQNRAFSTQSIREYESYHCRISHLPTAPPSQGLGSLSDVPRRTERRETSRYRSDFEEIQFLGRGGFGEVIKVRNRIDNRYYAIKRIRLDPSNVEYNRKILREVITLSRLHHDRVVRYYQAWIENEFEASASRTVELSTEDSPLSFGSEEEEDDDEDSWAEDGISSQRLYSSAQVSSNVSLSSLLQFHTGFTPEDGPSSSPLQNLTTPLDLSSQNHEENGKREGASILSGEPQYLYIQMEFCPNQTLRDVIDAGIEPNECWRLFRQVIEGLAHIHAQGMIHRDLKPGNIFLDTNGDVKIGDFGLAIGDEGGELATLRSSIRERADETVESLTRGIGTPFYVSPEQERPGNRYSHKVDMYSLGIIFLELWMPFKTAMERAVVLNDARTSEIRLPSLFSKPEMSKQLATLKNLLSHDPKARLSSSELLRSDLLPPKVEDEYINEAIRSVTTPGTPYYDRLLTALFMQPTDPLKDYTFDYHSGTIMDTTLLSQMDTIGEILGTIFRRHGAIELWPPLLLPKIRGETTGTHNRPPYYLSSSGQIVMLPCTLVRPFARFVAQTGLQDMRRYVVERVFRENLTGGQPRQLLECTFDIVYSREEGIMEELEVIRTAAEAIMNVLESSTTSFVLRLNHYEILSAILAQCLVPPAKRDATCEALAQYHQMSWPKLKNLLGSTVVIPTSCIDSMGKLAGFKGITYICGMIGWTNNPALDLPSDMGLKRLEDLLRSSKDSRNAFRHISTLTQLVDSLGIKMKVSIDPLFMHGDNLYSGTVFQLFLEDKKKTEAVAAGGNYRQLVNSYRFPTDHVRNIGAVGVCMSMSRLVTLRSGIASHRRKNDLEALIYSSCTDMLGEKLALAGALWDAGFKAHLCSEDTNSTEHIQKICRSQGVQVAIQLKDNSARGHSGIVKVRNLERRQEMDVPKSELVETLRAIFGESTRDTPSSHYPSRHEADLASTSGLAMPALHAFAPLNVTLFSPYGKIKGSQKNMIMDKAVRAMAPLFSSFGGTKPVEVLAHDLPREFIRKISDTLLEGEEALRRVLEGSHFDKEVANKLRMLLQTLRDKNECMVFLFSYRDAFLELVCLTK